MGTSNMGFADLRDCGISPDALANPERATAYRAYLDAEFTKLKEKGVTPATMPKRKARRYVEWSEK